MLGESNRMKQLRLQVTGSHARLPRSFGHIEDCSIVNTQVQWEKMHAGMALRGGVACIIEHREPEEQDVMMAPLARPGRAMGVHAGCRNRPVMVEDGAFRTWRRLARRRSRVGRLLLRVGVPA